MDFLGSIIKSMDKPPPLPQREKQIQRAKKALLQKQQQKEKETISKFKDKVLEQIGKFINDASSKRLTYEPMDKIYRTAIHEVVEHAGLLSYSFGQENEGRYIMIFKKEYPPSEEELASYRRGEEYDPNSEHNASTANTDKDVDNKASKKVEPSTDYQEKYVKLLGKDSGVEAAKVAIPNKNFGFVPSDNKRDQRSIEETLNEIRSRKRVRKDEEGQDDNEDPSDEKTTL